MGTGLLTQMRKGHVGIQQRAPAVGLWGRRSCPHVFFSGSFPSLGGRPGWDRGPWSPGGLEHPPRTCALLAGPWAAEAPGKPLSGLGFPCWASQPSMWKV